LKPAFSIKGVLKISGLTVLGAFITVLLIGVFYGGEIKKLLLDDINKSLSTEIQVRKIEFSVIRHFPFAAVELEGVVAKDAIASNDKDTLLKAEKLSLLFNLAGVFSKDLSIRKIILKNASVKITEYASGENNYHFWKSSGDTASTVVDLENVVLDNVRITYSDVRNSQLYIFNSAKGTLRGRFSSDTFVLKADADLVAEHFYAGKTDYMKNKRVKLRSVLTVDNNTGVYEFGKSSLRVEDLLFDVSGTVTSLAETTKLNLRVNSHEAELHDLLSMLPPSLATYFSGFRSTGKFVFQSAITGLAGHEHAPDVKFSFSLGGGSLRPRGSDVMLDRLSLAGTFLRTASKPAELRISSFNGTLNGRPVEGNLSVTDLENPFLTLSAKADLDLNSLREFIKHDTLEILNGTMKVNISFAGKIKDLKQYATSGNYRNDASGTIVLEDVTLKLKQNPLVYKNMNGNFLLHDNHVEVAGLRGNISSTDFLINGSLRNFITYLLIPNQDANMNITVRSSLIDLNEILENKSTTAADDTSYKIKLNPRLVCDLNISAEKIIFRKFEASAIRGQIHIEDQVITSPDLAFMSMEGNISMSASIATHRRDSVLIACKAKVSKVNITELFVQMENFGEETVTDRNLKGKVSADVVFRSSWTKDLTINPASVAAHADITIDNGELNDFKPVLSLSKYLKLADLKHIRFSTLSNRIEISGRKIYFPSMEIRSSALNLNASGTHDFDNMVDYRLNMLLSDVLGKKVKEQQTEFGLVDDDGLGHTKLFLSMKGPVDDPKFSYDKKAVSQKIAQDLRADQQNVRQLLKQEFGMFRKDSSLKQQKQKKEEMQVDWDASAANE
jgi:hypothetical protein